MSVDLAWAHERAIDVVEGQDHDDVGDNCEAMKVVDNRVSHSRRTSASPRALRVSSIVDLVR